MLYERDIFKQIVESRTILVYGASVVATQVGQCLMDDPYNVRVAAFVVTHAEGNPKVVLKRPVITLDVAEQVFPKDTLVVVACVEKNCQSIRQVLAKSNFTDIIYLTFESDLWTGIRGNYMRSRLDKLGYRYRLLQEELRELEEEAESFKKAAREEKVTELLWQRDLLSKYLPKMMSEEEIKAEIEKLEDKKIPSVMKHFKTNFNGLCDMGLVSKIAKEYQ